MPGKRGARRVALTGTPGTGKTTLAEALRKRGHVVVDLTAFAREQGLLGRLDAKRDTRVIDEAKLARAFAREFPAGPLFVEGHLSHLLPVERVLVLRADPRLIARRLRRRGYAEEKVRENAQAEALDVIAGEALAAHGARRAFEADATGKTRAALAEVAEAVIEGRKHRALARPGSAAWPLAPWV